MIRGEVYWADLVGLAVVNRQGDTLGTVAAVQDFGAHPVLRVRNEQMRDEGPPILIPFVEAFVDAVDLDGGRIDVDWGKDYS